MGMVIDRDTGRPIWYRAIHRKVLVVYTEHDFGEGAGGLWAAYVVPIKGQNQGEEVHTWRSEGTKMVESEARALYGAVTEDFDKRELVWNK